MYDGNSSSIEYLKNMASYNDWAFPRVWQLPLKVVRKTGFAINFAVIEKPNRNKTPCFLRILYRYYSTVAILHRFSASLRENGDHHKQMADFRFFSKQVVWAIVGI